jgi:ferredoxin
MATMITSECINCGACEPECPNNAITQADEIYVIDPLLCTECVGFHDYEACAAVCPVDCCVTDPNNVEDEGALIARAKDLHKDVAFAENFESRFRKDAGKAAAAPSGEAAPVATPPKPAAKPQPVAAAPSAPKAPAAAAQKAAPPKPAKPEKHFPGEVAGSFTEAFSRLKPQGPLTKPLARLLIFLFQPVLGALPHPIKIDLAKSVAQPFAFSAGGATALNVLHNIALFYPILLMLIGAAAHGPEILFSQDINNYILIGVVIGLVEGVYRLKEGIFGARPAEELIYRSAFYGVPLSYLLRPVLERQTGMVRNAPIPVDGFYERGFIEKLERERRYGNVYTLRDLGEAYFLRMEFPTQVPDIGLAIRSELPDEMPDYDYDLALKDGHFVIKGRITDERIRKISSSVGAFPPEFTTVVSLPQKVETFSHRFADKLLEILLFKQRASDVSGSAYF